MYTGQHKFSMGFIDVSDFRQWSNIYIKMKNKNGKPNIDVCSWLLNAKLIGCAPVAWRYVLGLTAAVQGTTLRHLKCN